MLPAGRGDGGGMGIVRFAGRGAGGGMRMVTEEGSVGYTDAVKSILDLAAFWV